MNTEALVGMITGIAALASVLIFIYNRGRHEGTLTAMINSLKDIVPQMLDVQQKLAAVCQQISEHASDLDRGSTKMETITEEISDIKERLVRLETMLKVFPLP